MNSLQEYATPTKHVKFKTLKLQSDLCTYSDPYIVVWGTITVTDADNDAYDNKLALHLLAAFQKLKIHSLTMQKIYTL